MGLESLAAEPGYLKAGFLGFASSGKTFTAVDMAIGVRKFFELKGPIAMFDTESGSKYINQLVKKGTGLDLVGKRARSFDMLMTTAKDCIKENVSVLIVDSITHVWRELCDAHLLSANETLKKRGRNPKFNLEFQDWGPIKRKWETWTDFYLNSPLHIIICGRAGHEYAQEENEQTGKKDLVKVGVKMKAESEFGFEPSLVVEMERVVALKDKDVFDRQATIIKDRFDVIDGKSCVNPSVKFFMPHIERLKPGSHTEIDITSKSKTELDDLGRDDYDRRRKDREIVLEQLEAEMVKRWPGQSAEQKKMKVLCLEKIFGETSWAKVAMMPLDELRLGVTMLRSLDDKLEVINVEPVSEAKNVVSQ